MSIMSAEARQAYDNLVAAIAKMREAAGLPAPTGIASTSMVVNLREIENSIMRADEVSESVPGGHKFI